MSYNTCLNHLINYYDNIVKYPVLGLYVKDPDLFLNTYLIIEEVNSISICKRDRTQIITIDKTNLDIGVFNKPLANLKEKKSDNKSKLFSLGNFEVYKKQVDA